MLFASFSKLITSNAQVRLLAKFVLLVILWGYVAPAALGPSEADLPACCRGKGEHHCAMAGMVRSDDGASGVRANSPQCPYRLLGSVLRSPAAATTKKLFSLELPAVDLYLQRDHTLCASAIRSRNSGRGPPTLSL